MLPRPFGGSAVVVGQSLRIDVVVVVCLLLLGPITTSTFVSGLATSSSSSTTTTTTGGTSGVIGTMRIPLATPQPIRLAAFVAQPFVQRALQSPASVQSVLNFFFGVETETAHGRAMLQYQGGVIQATMSGLWYTGGPAYDQVCTVFTDTVRAAGRREWPVLPAPLSPSLSATSLTSSVPQQQQQQQQQSPWVVDGKMAQLLLTDQLARNIFRGTPEAFAYEDVSLEVARELAHMSLRAGGDRDNRSDGAPPPPPAKGIKTQEEDQQTPNTCRSAAAVAAAAVNEPFFLYPPYLSFVAVALMHSELLSDQITCTDLLLQQQQQQQAQQNHYPGSSSSSGVDQLWDEQIVFAQDHRAVIERFGRFPHRNAAKGRSNTPAEAAWLADLDHLPGWARSQSSSSSSSSSSPSDQQQQQQQEQQ